jgi:hypothetical protein
VVAEFNGGTITSDGGVLLLKEVETKRKIIKQFATCFNDHRDPKLIVDRLDQGAVAHGGQAAWQSGDR